MNEIAARSHRAVRMRGDIDRETSRHHHLMRDVQSSKARQPPARCQARENAAPVQGSLTGRQVRKAQLQCKCRSGTVGAIGMIDGLLEWRKQQPFRHIRDRRDCLDRGREIPGTDPPLAGHVSKGHET